MGANQRQVTIRIILGLVLALGLQGAATVSYSAPPGEPRIIDPGLRELRPGHEVRIGFLADGTDPATASLTDLQAAWVSFGQTDIRRISNTDGRFAAQATRNQAAFAGRPILIWVLETLDGLPPRGDLANVGGFGLFGSSNAAWLFPDPGALPPANSSIISSGQIDRFYRGFLNGDALALEAIPLTYAEWSLAALGVASADPMGDPDRDGLANAIEYLAGLDPNASDPAEAVYQATIEPILDTDFFTLRTSIRTDRSDVTAVVEAAGIDYVFAPIGPVSSDVTGNLQIETWRWPTDAIRGYLRWRVTTAP